MALGRILYVITIHNRRIRIGKRKAVGYDSFVNDFTKRWKPNNVLDWNCDNLRTHLSIAREYHRAFSAHPAVLATGDAIKLSLEWQRLRKYFQLRGNGDNNHLSLAKLCHDHHCHSLAQNLASRARPPNGFSYSLRFGHQLKSKPFVGLICRIRTGKFWDGTKANPPRRAVMRPS